MKKSNGKKKSNGIRILLILLFLIFGAGIVISGYQIYSVLYENSKAEDSYDELRMIIKEQKETHAESATVSPEQQHSLDDSMPPERLKTVDISKIQETYPEVVAWLVCDGTGIDYPVMQTDNNDYYLHHLYDGSENSNGALFVDYRNHGLFTDDNTVIYGHNMRNGVMFHVLNEYKSQDFYDAYPTMRISTVDGDYLIELISGTIENGNYEFVEFNFEDFDEMNRYISGFISRSTFQSNITVQPSDKLISLCTCTYEEDNARYMLIGRVVSLYKE